MWLAVHPRGCGEHFAPSGSNPAQIGSSPRVRGTLGAEGKERYLKRFIPAGAGNTIQEDLAFSDVTVHPRGCGEHKDDRGFQVGDIGSSPRVRGTRAFTRARKPKRRFIPAGAGNTPTPGTKSSILSVHPRGCGEHAHIEARYRCATGSSPRVRGTHMVIPIITIKIRFIPAGAGNTWLSLRAHELTAVHPRGCGEHLITVLEKAREYGSSPRVRGTRPCTWPTAGASRFIPAGAGNTIGVLLVNSEFTVHPRGCGEHRQTAGS